MAGLEVQIVETTQGMIVHLRGEAGFLDSDKIHHSLLGLSAQRPAVVVFDLGELGFVASVVMGALVHFRRGQVLHGGKVILAALQPNVLEAFRSARLLDLFESVDSVDQAFQPNVA
jgi:anti-anti-sigma factor